MVPVMPNSPEVRGRDADFSSRSLRLDTLVRLRWLAVGGQTGAVLLVRFALGFPLPAELCLIVIGLSAALNLALRARYPATLRVGQWPAVALLAYDVVQLSALLYLTGGLENPFALLLLVPVIVSATTLPPRPTILLGLTVVAAATVLVTSHWPLPLPNGGLPLPLIYVIGVWVALVSACVFTGVYAFRVAEEARNLARALNATEMVLAREQHLYALDGLAAAAAHELGTPLATIALVAKELEREFPRQSARRRRRVAAQPVAALPRYPRPADLDVGPGRSSPGPPAAFPSRRGSRRGLPRLRRRDRRGAIGRHRHRAGRPPQSCHRAGAGQSCRKRRRLCGDTGDRRDSVERGGGHDRDFRRRPGVLGRHRRRGSASLT